MFTNNFARTWCMDEFNGELSKRRLLNRWKDEYKEFKQRSYENMGFPQKQSK